MAEINRVHAVRQAEPADLQGGGRRHRVLQAARQPARRADTSWPAAAGQRQRLAPVIKHYQLDMSALAKDLTAALDRLPRGASSISGIAENIADAVERGWVYGTCVRRQRRAQWLPAGRHAEDQEPAQRFDGDQPPVRKAQGRRSVRCAGQGRVRFARRRPERQRRQRRCGRRRGARRGQRRIAPAAMGKQEALKKFTVDLTNRRAKARWTDRRSRRRDPPGRRHLMRRPQNNPILVGEAGVGKTAVVEGLLSASHAAMCRRAGRTCSCAHSTSACCRPAPA